MYHGSNLPLRTIVILPDFSARKAFVATGNTDPRFRIIGEFESLGDAYTNTEAHPPDIIVCSKDVRLQPEFPMFNALLALLGSKLLTVPNGAGIEAVARMLGLPPITPVKAAGAPGVPLGTPQRLVAIGASTGGIEALSEVLSGYPINCPPTVIVQHIQAEYLAGVVDRFDLICPAKVVVGQARMKLCPGQVVFAPGLPSHIEVQAGAMRCVFTEGPRISGHRPSVDVLFNSAAHLKGQAVGVLLTGMGRDGATGLAAMRKAGAWTIVQDAATSTVYGMPRVASEEGAACEVLPLRKISKAILSAAIRTAEVAE